MKPLLLASTSPRRRELLDLLQVPFEVVPPVFDETSRPEWSEAEEVCALARGKGLSVAEKHSHSILIAADTLVSVDGEKLGKPRDAKDAERMLKRLSGRKHQVISGVFLWDGTKGEEILWHEVTGVFLKNLSEGEIRNYVAGGEPMGKAGAYAIQGEGSRLIEGIEGDYFNVVGLPLRRLYEQLQIWGLNLPVPWEAVATAVPGPWRQGWSGDQNSK